MLFALYNVITTPVCVCMYSPTDGYINPQPPLQHRILSIPNVASLTEPLNHVPTGHRQTSMTHAGEVCVCVLTE